MEALERMFPRGHAIMFVKPDGEIDYHIHFGDGRLNGEIVDALNRFINKAERDMNEGEEWKRGRPMEEDEDGEQVGT